MAARRYSSEYFTSRMRETPRAMRCARRSGGEGVDVLVTNNTGFSHISHLAGKIFISYAAYATEIYAGETQNAETDNDLCLLRDGREEQKWRTRSTALKLKAHRDRRSAAPGVRDLPKSKLKLRELRQSLLSTS